MCLWRRRRNHSCGPAVIVVIHERGARALRAAAALTRLTRLIKLVIKPTSVEIGVTSTTAESIKGMHPPCKMFVPLLLQPTQVRLLFVTGWPWTGSGDRRGSIFRSELG